MIKDGKIDENIKNLADKHDTTKKEVEKVVDLTYDFIRNSITALDFKNMTLKEFKEAKKNFYMPGLFKLYASEYYFKFLNKIKK